MDERKLYAETSLSPAGVNIWQAQERSAVNSVAIVTGQPWAAVVKSLIEQAHIRGNMPSYKTCITDMLRANGFRPLRFSGSVCEMLDVCDASFSLEKKYIAELPSDFFAVVPADCDERYIVKGVWKGSRPVANCRVERLWRYEPGADHRTGIKRTVMARALPAESDILTAKNVNPENKNTGDCVVRALCASYGCTWHDAIDHLAGAIKYTDPLLNVKDNINLTLVKLGFERNKAIMDRSGPLEGKLFCELMDRTYRDGERIFAYMGNTHCVAVLPEKQENGKTKYKIQDSWDSTARLITECWVYKAPAAVPVETEKPVSSFAVGGSIYHPQFGRGLVKAAFGEGAARILEIEFPEGGTKKLSEVWLKKIL